MMPLGNSITEGTGSSHDGGYRHDLYYLLQNAGIAFDFVGSLQYGSGFPDLDHEGHPGYLADQLDVQTILANNPADVVFLEVGTNDISYGESATEVRNDIDRLVDDIYNVNHAITIFLSTTLPRLDSNALQQITDAVNAMLPNLVSTKAAAGYRIYLVDNASRIKAEPNWETNLMADNLHPNDEGYALMANEWFNAYRAYSPPPPPPPPPSNVIFADNFNSGALDGNKWLRGSNAGNQAGVVGNALELRSNGAESGWVITRNGYPARNTTVTVKVVQPNDDGDLGMSPTYRLASSYGIYDQANWYRFYTYRNSNTGPYRLYVAWKKNGAEGGLDVTGGLTISGMLYLRLRSDNAAVHFEVSFDGTTWNEAYNEAFALPGYSLDSNFHYELAGYHTSAKGNLVVDNFSIESVSSEADTQPPQISGIAAQNLTASSAQLVWQTNEPADSQLEYGLTTNYGAFSPLEPTLTALHAVTLTNLTANTTYHCRVRSKDTAGNLAVSGDFTFATTPPSNAVFADDFNAGSLDGNKWRKGGDTGNQPAVISNALELRSSGSESGWVISRNAYSARNTSVAVKVVQPNNDGNLGMSPTYNLASPYGIYTEANWYRFYVYRNASTGPYRLYVAWKKNGSENGLDVTGNLAINSAVYLRLRFDNSQLHFEASLDGANWTDVYNETFGLPGYSLDTPFYYELAGYHTGSNGVLRVDDFAINNANTTPDTQPPIISSVVTQNVTGTSAQIGWQTNEAADSQVEYGLTTSYGSMTPIDAQLATTHSLALSNLQANTTYHYRVKSKDNSGNLAVSGDFVFTTSAPSAALFADEFNSGALDLNKWQKGKNSGNKTAVANSALDLKSQNSESGWVITKNAYSARNTTVTIKVIKSNDDGDLGISPTYNLSSQYGVYDQANWYRFYTYRNGHAGSYRLYVEWNKNGVSNGFDVTGNLVINSLVYLRLRFDNSNIHFEASLDGTNWTDTYHETFGLPGYTLDSPFYYELAAYKTGTNGILTMDDFSITGSSASGLAAKPASLDAASLSVPTDFALQNYPNPFNAATRIRFTLPQNAEIQLSVFDALGREVHELIAGSRPAGNYEVAWNGRDHNGDEMSTGFYLLRLRYRLEGSGAWSQVVRRVMMVK
jgi:lysophospholipase L1-like esterase